MPKTESTAITKSNFLKTGSIIVQFSPQYTPGYVRRADQIKEPMNVKKENFQIGTLNNPAGKEIKVRTIGIILL